MKVVKLTSWGCGKTDVDLGDSGLYTFATKYNITAAVWTLNIADSQGNDLLTGLMMVPEINLIEPYPAIAEKIGALYLVENHAGDYTRPNELGTNAYLVWQAPNELNI